MRVESSFFVVAIAISALPLFAQSNTAVDFRTDIAPIFEKNCTGCHHPGAGGTHLTFSSRDELVTDKAVVPGEPEKSALYTSVFKGNMPPTGKLPADQIATIRRWIEQDARWPPGVSLATGTKPQSASPASTGATSELAEAKRIHDRIVAARSNPAGTKAYKVTIPNTTISYDMVAIPAGEYTMGSQDKKDEQPVHKVTVSAFWMQAHEVTWDEYRLFMFANQAGEIAHKDELVDGVSRPTRPYVEMSFGMGINGFPAISMTQHAANKYAEWLSAKIGEFYRLPTEAEWEYACRADAAPPSAAQLSDSAWYSANSAGKYQKVAAKKPNAWGLFDMLGNVMEWTLDQYEPYKGGNQVDPWIKPTQPYPIAVRGGSWNDPADMVRCASRVASDPSWKQQDPQLPKSIWYETDAQWLGFRLVRPVKLPAAEEMYRYWNNGVEHDEQ